MAIRPLHALNMDILYHIPVYSGFNATAVSLEGDKPIGILHHECFGNGERVHFVRLGLADVVLAHG